MVDVVPTSCRHISPDAVRKAHFETRQELLEELEEEAQRGRAERRSAVCGG